MAVYTIQDTTLTGIADAIREKQGVVPITSGILAGGQDWGNFEPALINLTPGGIYKLIITPTYVSKGAEGYFYAGGNVAGVKISDKVIFEEGITQEFILSLPEDEDYINYYWVQNKGYQLKGTYTLEEIDENGDSVYAIKPTEMADVINELKLIPEESLIFKGTCKYRWAYNYMNWLFKTCGEELTTQDITTRDYMFYDSNTLEEIPFDINLSTNNFGIDYAFYNCAKLKKIPSIIGEMCSFSHAFDGCTSLESIPNLTWGRQSSAYGDADAVFKNCSNLKNVPYIYNLSPSDLKELFYGCENLQIIPEDYTDTWNWNRIHTYTYGYGGAVFYGCDSLRNIPTTMLHNLWNIYTSSSSNMYNQLFMNCHSLNEVKELGISSASLTSNVFGGIFSYCSRLKDFTFQTNEDGTPQIAKWKSQTIDLTTYVGYSLEARKQYILNYNSGITADKEVFDDTTYQLLKNDPDWFSIDLAYSRYNHDSAVNTINSLPDCSATGTNIIKFKGESGSATDGGAINTLTEEEIAVATAKGWTVSLV